MSELEIVKRLKEVMKRAEQLNRIQLVVGIPSDENSRKESTGITNAELGVIHEFGAPEKGIPERSFMRSTASEEAENLGRLGNACIAECLKGQKSAHDAFADVGAYLQGKIVEKITDGDFVANKEETAKRKKSSKPLIDTGQLRASITYEVRENES
jgi:phage gpG-like protein